MSEIKDQPPPAATAGRPAWATDLRAQRLVLADMRDRDRIGRERYGTPLQAHNGRDALVDAYQEALDLCAYLRQGVEEERAASSAEACRFNDRHGCEAHDIAGVDLDTTECAKVGVAPSEDAYRRALALVFELRELIEARRR